MRELLPAYPAGSVPSVAAPAWRPELRVHLDQHVHVVWHHLHLDHHCIPFRENGTDEGREPLIHAVHDHLAPFSGAPHNVLLAGEHHALVRPHNDPYVLTVQRSVA